MSRRPVVSYRICDEIRCGFARIVHAQPYAVVKHEPRVGKISNRGNRIERYCKKRPVPR